MRKALLVLGLATIFATPTMADQKTAVLSMIRDPNHVGPAIPTGYEVDRRPLEGHGWSHHHRHHWVKRYLHAHG
jgi:hypothetical protein